VVRDAGTDAQLALIRAHPELAGKAMVSKNADGRIHQRASKAGLTHCTPEEFARIQQLNADYNAALASRSSWRCAGRAARACPSRRSSTPLSAACNHPDFELAECAAQHPPHCRDPPERQVWRRAHCWATEVWDWQEKLAQHSDPGFAEKGQLTVTYLTDAHRACAQRISSGCAMRV
jgi:N-carbamoyl-L-amino-acid hydrolase